MPRLYVNLLVSCLILPITIAGRTQAAATFVPLGDLPGGGFGSGALAISTDGHVVVGYGTTEFGVSAFRWTRETGMIAIDLPSEASSSHAFGVSADGSVIVGTYNSPSGDQAFRWTESLGLQDLGPAGLASNGFGISADGSIIVGSNNYQAFRWIGSAEGDDLGLLPGGSNSVAFDVSGNGSVIVGTADSNQRDVHDEAFRWTAEDGMTGLGYLTRGPSYETWSSASAISNDGTTIVGHSFSNSGYQAFRWTEDSGMVSLGVLPGYAESAATDVSADGSVIVGYSYGGFLGAVDGMLWTSSTGLVDIREFLSTRGVIEAFEWSSLAAYAISADGTTVVGAGINGSGNREAWLVTIPESSSLIFTGLVMIPLSLVAFRNRNGALASC